MKRECRMVATLVSILAVAFTFSISAAQDSTSSQPAAAPQAASGGSQAQTDANTPADPKKPKRVWTNENLTEVNRSAISQVGDAKDGVSGKTAAGKPAAGKPAISPAAAALRKQLATIQAQMSEIDKQIAELKSFMKGETPGANGLQLHKYYSTEPIPDQVRKLEEKKKSLAERMDALVDAARKQGILPGQLR